MLVCTKFTKYEKGSLIGFADITVPKWGIEIKGCALCKKDTQRWVNLPAKEFITPTGEKKFTPHVRFHDQKHWKIFCTQAKNAIDLYILESQQLENAVEHEINETKNKVRS